MGEIYAARHALKTKERLRSAIPLKNYVKDLIAQEPFKFPSESIMRTMYSYPSVQPSPHLVAQIKDRLERVVFCAIPRWLDISVADAGMSEVVDHAYSHDIRLAINKIYSLLEIHSLKLDCPTVAHAFRKAVAEIETTGDRLLDIIANAVIGEEDDFGTRKSKQAVWKKNKPNVIQLLLEVCDIEFPHLSKMLQAVPVQKPITTIDNDDVARLKKDSLN